MKARRRNYIIFIVLGFLILLFFIDISVAQAQYWAALPPYNTLWPLWSPALSPVDSATGLPVPIVDNLSPSTILPVQPGLTWDPSWAYPWLLYNTPSGLSYFDQIYGFNAWPAPHLVDPATGSAIPILLKGPWAKLAPTLIDWGQQYVPLANITYAFLYQLNPVDFASLLTPAAIWGL